VSERTGPVVLTETLGRRYGRRWALRDCSLSLPAGHVIGLVGPNGAGKTTLLHLAVGLLAPSAGQVRVLGATPRDPATRVRVAFVAQDKPLYPRFTVAETLRMGGWLNPGFDQARARDHLERLGIPADQRVGRLSGGQHAQVALALAVGKRPDLLLLDEPVANLDPLARRDFMRVLMEEVAATGMTVVLSSHLIEDLERCCDYLVLLSRSRVQLSAATDDLLAAHRLLAGPRERAGGIAESHTIVQASASGRQASLVVRTRGPVCDPGFSVRPVTLSELVLAYMSEPDAGEFPALTLAGQVRQASR
jgi:ABC-2 type transport system ATP-binding protein